MPVKIFQNQNGFALIASMLFLMVLSIIGIAAINTTSVEVNIAGNDRIYKQNFYLAEGAAKEAAVQDLRSSWVYEPNKLTPPPMNGNEIDFDDPTLLLQTSNLGANTNYVAVDNDIPPGVLGSGHSLKVEGTGVGGKMNFFDLYGQSVQNNSLVRIKMGYTKRL